MRRRLRSQQIKILSIVGIAVLTLSIGFAAFSTVLRISSSATINPDKGSFSVKFSSSSSKLETNNIVPSTTGGATGEEAIIMNGENPTITRLNANFKEPGEEVSYTFWVRNDGAYLAYLTSIVFENVQGKDLTKVCTPGEGATEELVNAACEGISLKLELDGMETSATQLGITGSTLNKEESKVVKVTIAYDQNAARADGPFTIAFGDIYVTYGSIETDEMPVLPSQNYDTWDGVSATALSDIAYDSSTKTYTLNSAADLAGIRDAINSGSVTGEYNVVLNTSVDLAGHDWTPIGTMSADYDTYDASRGYFEGTFDGNGNTVANIYVVTDTTDAVGFFGGVAGNVSIKNLNLSGGKFITTGKTAAGLVAYAIDKTDSVTNITIENCSTDVEVKGADATAGILGRAYNSGIKTVTNCENSGTITGPGNVSNRGKVAGIVGLSNGSQLVITNSTNYGDVTNGSFIGGILGFVNLGSYTIENSFNYGTIGRADDDDYAYNAGGFVGKINTGSAVGTINNSKNYGEVSANIYAGGVVGVHGAPAISVTNSENNGLIKSDDTAGGIVAHASSSSTLMQITGNANNGEVTASNYAGGIIGISVNTLNQNNTNTGKVTSTNSIAGGIVASLDEKYTVSTTISECVNTGEIISSNSSSGGIVGVISTSLVGIDKCENSGSIKSPTLAGGIAGNLGYKNGVQVTANISNSINKGDVTATNGTAGGILSNTSTGTTITGNENSGLITAYNWAGGIVGRNLYATVSGCSNSGKVVSTGKVNTSDSNDYSAKYAAGGIVGDNYGSTAVATVSNSNNSGEVVAELTAGGIAGLSANESKIENSHNTGKVTSSSGSAGGVVGDAGTTQTYPSTKVSILSCSGGTAEIIGSRPGRIIGSASSYEQGGVYITMSSNADGNDISTIGNVGGISRHTKIYFTGTPYWVDGEPYSSYMKQTSWNSLQIDISIYYDGNLAWQYLSAGTNTWTIRS